MLFDEKKKIIVNTQLHSEVQCLSGMNKTVMDRAQVYDNNWTQLL